MKADRAPLVRFLVHLLVAAPVFAAGWYLLATAPADLSAVVRLLGGMGLFVLSAIIVAFPIAQLVAQPTGNLFYPEIRDGRPRPNYSIVEAKVQKGEYEEAITAYAKLASAYPEEIKTHIGMIKVAMVHLKDPVRASQLYHRAAATLKHRPDKQIVWRRYRQFASLLESERERKEDRTVHLPRGNG